jgi:hypothetical protein
MIRQKLMLTLALILILSVLAACGGRGDSGSSIWPDVPVPTDARNSDIRLPLPMRLLIQTAVRASARGDDVNVDKFDFVGYTTAQSPQQVAEFYSAEAHERGRLECGRWHELPDGHERQRRAGRWLLYVRQGQRRPAEPAHHRHRPG